MENDFMDDELDPLDIVKAKEQFEIDMELSVIAAYDIVYKAGVENWNKQVEFSDEKKLRILANMEKWFAEHEYYDRAIFIRDGIAAIKGENALEQIKTMI
jgi:hypothetical protein